MKVWEAVESCHEFERRLGLLTCGGSLFYRQVKSVVIREPKMNICKGYIAIALAFAASMLLSGRALAQETERPARMKDLPQAVQTTLREQSRGAAVRGLSIETEKGQTFYEASLKVKGRVRDVLIDADGNVVEIEEQVTLASLPPAARAEIVKQAGKGRILTVESITKKNAIVAYEAHVKTAGKISEIKVDPDGKPLPLE
jgi:uncharacterized membrane protein YkoI